MRNDADQLFRRIARQSRVRIERDAIAHRREDAQFADLHAEARVGCASQQPVEFLDLSAFALPPHPRVLLSIPAPRTMKQKKAIRMFGAEPSIQVLDTRACSGKNRWVAGQFARIGVGEIAENREMD